MIFPAINLATSSQGINHLIPQGCSSSPIAGRAPPAPVLPPPTPAPAPPTPPPAAPVPVPPPAPVWLGMVWGLGLGWVSWG